jgi:hypothetical protein
MPKPIVLYTPYYGSDSVERQKELDECLQRNVLNPLVSRIILLRDDNHVPPVDSKKIVIMQFDERPTYRDWLELSMEGEAHISVLANTDIYFDESILNLCKYLDGEVFVALSRYEKVKEEFVPHPNPHWSQDVWCVDTENKFTETLLRSADIKLGIPRCDNKIAYVFSINGWKVSNPFYEIISIHVHETQIRNYNKKRDTSILGGVAYVHPVISHRQPSQLEFDIWTLRSDDIQDLRVNKTLEREIRTSNVSKMDLSLCFEELDMLDIANANQFKKVACTSPVFESSRRFFIYEEEDGKHIFYDRRMPTRFKRANIKEFLSIEESAAYAFIPNVVDIFPISVTNRPKNLDDVNFWQYPCHTERQAFENHVALVPYSNINIKENRLEIYLPLPWATYIDKKITPKEVTEYIKPKIRGYRQLANDCGFELRVHTVCQQIHWKRLLELFFDIGVTDLHLSHLTKAAIRACSSVNIIAHSWPLIGVNIENEDRRVGLVFGKKTKERKYLYSFIGAHMPHYLSDVRVKLNEVLKADKEGVYALTNEWHFNKVVYEEQVSNRKISGEDQVRHEDKTRKYNELISDSIFSLCPEGAGPNTLRIWESMAVGSIPVIIADDWIAPFSNSELDTFAVKVSRNEVTTLIPILKNIPTSKRQNMSTQCMSVYDKVKYKTCFGNLQYER